MFVHLVKNLTRFIRNSLLLHFPFTAERFARLEFGAKWSIICSTSTSKLYLFNIVLRDIADSDEEHDSELYYLTLDNSDNSDIKAGI